MPKVFYRNDKKLIWSWAMYDWANSVYSLSIATAIFPIYYTQMTNAIDNGTVYFIGREFNNGALYSYCVSISFLLVALMSPILSSIADYIGNKLIFMKAFCYTGSVSCIALYWFTAQNVQWGLVIFIVASVGFAGSLVFYNAYLKEIADESLQDRVSAKGFALGYIGSVILLVANLVTILFYKQIGFSSAELPTRLSFITVGIWWAGWAQITFSALKKFKYELANAESNKMTLNVLFGGYNELRKVFFQIKTIPSLRNFLAAFFFYNGATQTVMYLSTIYGTQVLHLDQTKLIATVLVIQLVAIAGANWFARISGKKGNVFSLSIAIFIWMGICVFAYFLTNEYEFYAIAFAVGLVMGGIQSMSRSTYSKLLPQTKDTASFFSFFDVTDKIATVSGTLLYGLVTELTGDMRNAVLFLIIFFVIGFGLLTTVRKSESLKPTPT